MNDTKNNSNTVLIADDEPEIQNVVKRYLTRHGYETISASDGQEALSKAKVQQPSVVLLDVNMPKMDGFSVCQKLREYPSTRLIPVLMLTARTALDDKVNGLGRGADDYLNKPFDLPELMARIEALLRRNRNMISVNPLTQLPGTPTIQDEIERRIQSGQKFGVAYIDIDHFKAYNDVYGYCQGDEVIRATSKLLQKIVDQSSRPANENHCPHPFLGHIGGDDFILISDSQSMRSLCEAIAAEFDQLRYIWYNWWHNLRGHIETKDRQGNMCKFPLMALSIAVATNDKRSITHYAQVAQITSELKKLAKDRAVKNKSFTVFDRRTS